VLKKLDASSFKDLHMHLHKLQTTIRSAGVDLSNQEALRARNQRLQRIHQAMSVLEFHAKQLRIVLV